MNADLDCLNALDKSYSLAEKGLEPATTTPGAIKPPPQFDLITVNIINSSS